MMQDWIWLTTRRGLRPRGVMKVLAHFSSPEEAFYAHKDEYRLAGLSEQEAESLEDKDLGGARRILEECAEKDIRIVTIQDAAYSNRLRSIADPPAVLYYRGILPALDEEPLVAVIGSRKSSLYGLAMAKRIGYQIAACGGIVVSGLAAGGDGMAMTGAVTTGRPVIGVLGSGVDVIYPRSNAHLYEDVLNRGCILSEYPPGTRPTRYTFPARNRIISGLSLGVVVVEAPAKSGTLITANFALEQGRDLFAVPGTANSRCCAGSNRLLKEGAILAETGWDVMSEYEALFPGRVREVRSGRAITLSTAELSENLQPVRPPRAKLACAAPPYGGDKKSVDIPARPGYIDIQDLPGLSEGEREILEALQAGPMCVDDLIAACSGGAGSVLSSLTLLEIKKYAVRLDGSRYELARK